MSTGMRMVGRPQDSLRMLLGLGLALGLVFACPRVTTFCAGLGLLFFLPFAIVEALDGILGPGRRHVTLRVQMGLIVLLGIAFSLPGTLLYYLGMALLYVVSLAAVSALEGLLRRVPRGSDRPDSESIVTPTPALPQRLLFFIVRPLTICTHSADIDLTRALWIAVIHSATIVGLWPLLSELSIEVMNRFRQQADLFTWPIEMWQLPASLSSPEYWKHVALLEAWSLTRWWLLFGALALGYYLLARRQRPGIEYDGWTLLRRVLLFAPWLVALETGYLVGLSVLDNLPIPLVVLLAPLVDDLPSAVWPLRVWVIGGVLPTVVAGVVFFRLCLECTWSPCIYATVVFVPVALCLSALWTALYVRWILVLV